MKKNFCFVAVAAAFSLFGIVAHAALISPVTTGFSDVDWGHPKYEPIYYLASG